jgi:electron transport complex protein RnfE
VAKDPKQKSLGTIFTRGIIAENPVLRLILGTCPTLAVSTGAMNALGMGAAATVVLICSNVVISLLRNVIPDKVRIPAYITIIAGFVTIIQLFVKGFVPSIDKSLGIYLPLIVVNCIILGRAEMFASKNRVLASAVDGLGMGVGFTAAMLAMGIIREVIGAGSIFGVDIYTSFMPPMIIFILPAGGFFVYGILIAIVNKITLKKNPKAVIIQEFSCEKCPMNESCSKSGKKGCE